MSTSLAIELKELARVAMPTKLYLRIEENNDFELFILDSKFKAIQGGG